MNSDLLDHPKIISTSISVLCGLHYSPRIDSPRVTNKSAFTPIPHGGFWSWYEERSEMVSIIATRVSILYGSATALWHHGRVRFGSVTVIVLLLIR